MELEQGIFGDGCGERSEVFLAVLVENTNVRLVHIAITRYLARRKLTPQKK